MYKCVLWRVSRPGVHGVAGMVVAESPLHVLLIVHDSLVVHAISIHIPVVIIYTSVHALWIIVHIGVGFGRMPSSVKTVRESQFPFSGARQPERRVRYSRSESATDRCLVVAEGEGLLMDLGLDHGAEVFLFLRLTELLF